MTAAPASAAATAAPDTIGTGAGSVARRVRSVTGRSNSMISPPRSVASSRSSRSGLTATAWPTASSMGRSVTLSEYAYESANEMSLRAA